MQIEPGKLDRLGHNLKFRALVWVTVSWFLLAAGFLQNVYADSPTLYAGEGGDGGSLIMVLNPATGAAISAVDLQQSLTGLALHPTTRVLYGSIASANSGTIPGNTLVTVNPDTLVVTTIGPFNIGAPLPDLAFDPATNILYGWSGGSGGTGDLHTVNLVTGAATKVAESGLSFGNGPGLAFANGNLYLAGNGDCGVLHTINAATGLSQHPCS